MVNSFAAQLVDALEASWPAIARPNQLPPPGDWQVWLLLAGQGFGKTRTLAEWVCQQIPGRKRYRAGHKLRSRRSPSTVKGPPGSINSFRGTRGAPGASPQSLAH